MENYCLKLHYGTLIITYSVICIENSDQYYTSLIPNATFNAIMPAKKSHEHEIQLPCKDFGSRFELPYRRINSVCSN